MGAWTWQTRNRSDRHVRHAKLCVRDDAPRRRLAINLEEALRIASLPGENEGRFYCFRFLRITGLPVDGNQSIWLKKVQWALADMAEQAIHGNDPLAASVGAVFFRSEQEALEVLLDHLLARRPITEWFWPMVVAEVAVVAASPSLSAELIPVLVERLRARPASWVAVATALFAKPGFDVVNFLHPIPPALAQEWVAEMTGLSDLPAAAGAHFSQETLPAIHGAARVFGLQSARTLWLAALAILFDCPSELVAGTVVGNALGALQRLASVQGIHLDRAFLAAREEPPTVTLAEPTATVHSEREGSGGAFPPSAKTNEALMRFKAATSKGPKIPVPDALPGLGISDAHLALESLPSLATDSAIRPAASPEGRWFFCSGVETRAAGLFFLLNGLRWIGIEPALADGLARADPHFLPRLLLRLAQPAGVPADDPALLWLHSLLSTTSDEALPCDRSCWPSNFRPWRDAAPLDYMLRVWYLAARRWCWRTAGITIRELVSRAGAFSVSRTDLDVSLPIEQADIRVRRAGLDLDPGWLPWFGRVVRFHYVFRGEFHA